MVNDDESKNSTIKTPEESSSVKAEKQNSQEICRFYCQGKCKYGRSGKSTDESGRICNFSHPKICMKFQNYGNTQNGCKVKECTYLHLKVCKIYMKYKKCKFQEKCKNLHPRKLKYIKCEECPANFGNTDSLKLHIQKAHRTHEHNPNEENLTYAKVTSKN